MILLALALSLASSPQDDPWPARTDVGPLQPGISAQVFWIDEPMNRLLLLVEGQTPNVNLVAPTIDFEYGDFEDVERDFIAMIDGYLNVPETGAYGFRLRSDDGARLWIDGRELVDCDGNHPAQDCDGDVALAKGWHRLRVKFFQATGDWEVSLRWKVPGAEDFALVPTESLGCTAGEVRVTSPGQKRILRPLRRGRPGDGEPLPGVHPSFRVSSARPEGFKPKVGGIDFLSDGRLVVCTWDSDGAVYLLDGLERGDPEAIEVQRYAAGLAEPLGLAVVDDSIFVLQKQELTQLIDYDGDEVADEYRAICSGWDVTANFHEFAFGLVYRPEEKAFYANLAVAIEPGGASSNPQVPDRGRAIRIPLESGRYEHVAHGLRTPNGIGIGPRDAIYITDNQGDWVPVSKVVELRDGAFYGSQAVGGEAVAELPVTQPVVWMPQNEIGNSPTEPGKIDIGPWAGQLIVGDVTHGGIKRAFLDEVEGEIQGALFRFTQGLEAGVNRITWGPDGALYVGGVGSTGNWSQTGKLWYGLERLEYTGESTFEPIAMRSRANGFEVEFTEPLAEGSGWDAAEYELRQWHYVPTSNYGGPKVDEVRLPVLSASVSADRKRVFLETEGLRAGSVVYLRLLAGLRSEQGDDPWCTEVWYTLNRIATQAGERLESPHRPLVNALTAAEEAAGWKLLFDGRTFAGWTNFKATGAPKGWSVEDGCLARTGAGGDIVTEDVFEDFELELEWKIAPAGNSGIFFHVSDEHSYVWQSGPEMQVLDNALHRDGQNPLTSAGSNYALHAADRDDTRSVGSFNRARIRVQGGRVEQWLNGIQQCSYQLGSPEWEELVAKSKFASMPAYGRAGKGRIALQDHSDPVWFRSIKIRRLDP